jgi:hypothetical protein
MSCPQTVRSTPRNRRRRSMRLTRNHSGSSILNFFNHLSMVAHPEKRRI